MAPRLPLADGRGSEVFVASRDRAGAFVKHKARARLAVVLACFLVAESAVAQVPRTTPGIEVVVVEGDGAINNVSRGTGFEPVVEVRNLSGRPVVGASVTFVLPAYGPSGIFPDGSKTLVSRTDENGRAVARGLRPNRVTGQFQIRVMASHEGLSASTNITQTNAAPAEARRGSGRKWAILLGVIGGAAAAGAVAATGGSGGSSTAARPPSLPSDPPAGSITPGTPSFGAPR
ncbi:MAG: hypothetical protein HYZ57_04680 [Acidobacteria bacterium]|nr:hypothetical protein [Acidobacteriota bacterium]MBI3279119.1 hypothetical protein [Acidobacteriota bacterium]